MFKYELYAAIKAQNLRATAKYRCIEEIVEQCSEAKKLLIEHIRSKPEVDKKVQYYIELYKQKLQAAGDRSWLCDRGKELNIETIFTDSLVFILGKEVIDEIAEEFNLVGSEYIKTFKKLANKIPKYAEDAFYFYAKYIFSIYSSIYAMERNNNANNSSVAEYDYSYILSSLSILFSVGFYRFDLSKGSFPTYITIWLKNAICHMPYKETVSLVQSKSGEKMLRVTGTPLADNESEYASDLDSEIIDSVSNTVDTDNILSDFNINLFRNINAVVKRPLIMIIRDNTILI